MKKFTLVPVGECFEYQGEQYSKSGPLTAVSLQSNRQRMIPRSAMVRPLHGSDTAHQQPVAKPDVTIDPARLREAFEHYHYGCLEWLRYAESELSEETATQFRQALEQARQRLFDELGLN